MEFGSPLRAACAAGIIATFIPVAARASSWSTDVSAPERAGYSLVYAKDLTTSSANGAAIVYGTDNSGSIANGSFDRVGYYLELNSATFGRQFVWAAFDTLTPQANKTGVPNDTSGEFYQANLANMNVQSNVGSIVTGNGIQTGNIEFWSTNYSPPNAASVPNADVNKYDFGDKADPGGYGSMQIHNHDLDGAGSGTAGQTIFGYNNWGGNGTDLGIGNNTNVANGGDPDWTFANNGGLYSARVLEVYVHAVPEPTSLGLLMLGAAGLFGRRRRA